MSCGCTDGCSAPPASSEDISARKDTSRTVSYSREYNQQVYLTSVIYSYCIFIDKSITLVRQLGNYLGALSNWVKLQNNAQPGDELIFAVVGWHALTLPQNPKELSACRRDALAAILAIGIDPNRSILFHQDQASVLCNIHTVLISDKGSYTYGTGMDP